MFIIEKYLSLLPEFCLILLTTCIIFFAFSGITFFINKKTVTILNATVTFYVMISVFITLVNSIANLYFNPLQAIVFAFFIICIIGLVGWVRSYKRFEKPTRLTYILLCFSSIILSLFLFNFGYDNGLHDDYFHHAVVQLFFKTNTFPFLNPYIFNESISSFYHYGLYFIPIVLKAILGLSVEGAIDWTKIVLFLPAPLAIGLSLQKIFKERNVLLITLITTVLFISGPSFFLKDSFFAFLAQVPNSAQIFMPLLYEFAGITWLGFIFSQVYFLCIILITQKELHFNTFGLILFFIASCVGLQLINQAFYLTFLFQSGIYLLLHYKEYFIKQFKKNVFVSLAAVSLTFIIIIVTLSQFRTTRLAVDSLTSTIFSGTYSSGLPYAAAIRADGIQIETEFLPITNANFYRSVGITWFISTLIFIYVLLKKQTNPVLLTLGISSTVLPLLVYFIHPPSLDLAINKLLQPAMFSSLLLIFYAIQHTLKPIRLVLVLILLIGIINPLRFFIVNQGNHLQQFWQVSDVETKELLSFFNTDKTLLLSTNDQNLSYILANTQNAQVQVCYENCDTAEYVVIDKSKNNYFSNSVNAPAFENNRYSVVETKKGR